ncbi:MULTISPECIES: RagB/SusD family nutrient uptake outer membrane protein [unclassified Sphingobacterium]|uniref:RagB/SusD family nutrient uptake outer membrane protein n=1 Tax=unclassified Sphingobacterium TaxID=2609468 RepID=UPI0010480F99|nr:MULTISPECIES: RagB/SusD family nutrient uptake outer membrane protein [unclassified Sphingobacterium]MCS3556132.1 hypothetical protein [Sphingobacterium sp. JUb21]TCR08508.1 putative outer membrane starch-binding protein [Sphingobacterium sp. JUb20]
MKKIIFILFVALSSFGTLSCSKNFFSHQPDFYSEENVFNNVDLAEKAVNSLLARRMIETDLVKISLMNIGGDDVTTKVVTSFAQFANGDMNPTSSLPINLWQNSYRQIRMANKLLSSLENKTEWGTSRDQLLGETYFMRAYYYMELLNFFGGKNLGVPLILEAMDPDDNIFIDRSSYTTCVNAVYADLDQAIKLLSTPAQSTVNRPNRGIAMGYKARMALYAASIENNPTNDQKLWQFAAQTAKNLIDSNYYSLHTDYEDIFLTNNPEIMFFYKSDNQIVAHYTDAFIQSPANRGQTGIVPTQELVDSYEVIEKDGKAVAFDWNNVLHASQPYHNRDPRFAASILYHGSTWVNGNGGKRLIDVSATGIDITANLQYSTPTGYYIKKSADPDYFRRTNSGGTLSSLTNFIEMRYGEVILNYAECLLALGQAQEAVHYVNLIRSRESVNMPALKADELSWERYVNERKVELAFERHRYFDVRRWGQSAKVFNTSYHGVNVLLDDVGKPSYILKQVNQRSYPAKMDKLPIPQSDVDIIRSAVPSFQQNPGW